MYITLENNSIFKGIVIAFPIDILFITLFLDYFSTLFDLSFVIPFCKLSTIFSPLGFSTTYIYDTVFLTVLIIKASSDQLGQ